MKFHPLLCIAEIGLACKTLWFHYFFILYFQKWVKYKLFEMKISKIHSSLIIEPEDFHLGYFMVYCYISLNQENYPFI